MSIELNELNELNESIKRDSLWGCFKVLDKYDREKQKKLLNSRDYWGNEPLKLALAYKRPYLVNYFLEILTGNIVSANNICSIISNLEAAVSFYKAQIPTHPIRHDFGNVGFGAGHFHSPYNTNSNSGAGSGAGGSLMDEPFPMDDPLPNAANLNENEVDDERDVFWEKCDPYTLLNQKPYSSLALKPAAPVVQETAAIPNPEISQPLTTKPGVLKELEITPTEIRVQKMDPVTPTKVESRILQPLLPKNDNVVVQQEETIEPQPEPSPKRQKITLTEKTEVVQTEKHERTLLYYFEKQTKAKAQHTIGKENKPNHKKKRARAYE